MAETLTAFHFGEPVWLWALLVPLPIAIWLWATASTTDNSRIQRYADAHLLPHLLGTEHFHPLGKWRRYGYWLLLWSLLVLAMASPRWSFTDVQLFRPSSNLVVLLDISRSMDVTDEQPSRLARARQELEDLINESQALRIGVIAFASVAHVVSPLTEDTQSILRILPALSTNLVHFQGSRLSEALERAGQLLAGQPEDSSNSILLISDGDFAEEGLAARIKQLASKGVRVHALGVGTTQGGWVPGQGQDSGMMGYNMPVLSRLNESLLRSLATAGRGSYQHASFRDTDTNTLLSEVNKNSTMHAMGDRETRVWHERFYWLVGLAILLLIPQYRRIWFARR